MKEEQNIEKELKKEKKSSKNEIKELEDKIKTLEEEVLRSKADLINYRKRKDEEVNNFIKYANCGLIESILPIVDNFERAIAIDESKLNDDVKNFLVGFKMIYQNLTETLKTIGVKEIECLNKPFDSKLENCVFTESNPNFDDEVVLEVFAKGYTFNDKVLRCASVKVNKINKEKEDE